MFGTLGRGFPSSPMPRRVFSLQFWRIFLVWIRGFMGADNLLYFHLLSIWTSTLQHHITSTSFTSELYIALNWLHRHVGNDIKISVFTFKEYLYTVNSLKKIVFSNIYEKVWLLSLACKRLLYVQDVLSFSIDGDKTSWINSKSATLIYQSLSNVIDIFV